MWPTVGNRIARPVVAIALAMLAGCRSADPSLFPPRPGKPTAEAIVLDNHWHTALIFRQADLPEKLRGDLWRTAGSRYVMIGWGDEGFFRAEHVTAGLAFQAMFDSRGSVMLVVGFDTEPEEMFDPIVDIYRVPTSGAGLAKTITFVSDAFRRKDGEMVDAGPGIDGGRFYKANGHYAFYRTCNHWTADALAVGGLPVTPAYAATAGNVAFQLRQLQSVLLNGKLVPTPRGPDALALPLARGRRL